MRDLFFRIRATDATGAAFAKVKANLKGIEGAAARAQERINRFARGMRNVGAGLTAVGATLGLAFRDSLSAWDDAAKAQTKVEQAIRSTGGAAGFTAEQLGAFADAFQRTTRFDGDDILGKVTAQLLTFTNVSGEAFRRAQGAVLDMATLLDGDLQGAAIQVGKALNDPIRGLTALGKVGVTFTAAQKDTIRSLVETGQVAKAQALILDELNREFGGQAQAAAQTGLGFLDQFRNAWGDVQEIVGGVLAEVAGPLVGIMQAVVGAFAGLPAPVQRFTVLLGLAVVVIGPLIAGIGLLILGLGAVSAPALAVAAGIAVVTAGVIALWPQITALGGWFVEAFTVAKDATLGFVESVVTWFEGANLWFGPVGLAAQALADLFALVFPETAAAVGKAVEEIRAWLTGKLGEAFDWVMGKVGAVGDAFATLYDRVVGHSYVPDMVSEVGTEFGKLQGNMVDPATAATEQVGGAFRDLGSGVGSALGEMIREGDFTFSGFAKRMVDQAGQMADSIVNDAFGRVGEAAKGLGGGGGIGGFFGNVLGGLFGGGVPGFASGGDFEVGGRGGVDRNLAVMRVSRGERVSVARRGDPRGSGGGVTVNISTPDPAAFAASRGQVAATVSRAVARGQRNL